MTSQHGASAVLSSFETHRPFLLSDLQNKNYNRAHVGCSFYRFQKISLDGATPISL